MYGSRLGMGGDAHAQLSFVQMSRVELLRKRHDQCLPLISLPAYGECDCYFAWICYLYSFFNVAIYRCSMCPDPYVYLRWWFHG